MSSQGPGSSPGHRKQRAPPPPPYDAVAVQRPLGPGGAGAPHAIPRGIGGGGGGGGGGGARTKDHVAELQALGRRDGAYGDDSDEEPPFNFKGMLRKTNCNRPSFRRSTDTSKEESIYGPSKMFRGHRDFVMPKSTSNNNNVMFNQNDSKTEKSCISISDDKSSLSCINNNWKSDEIWHEEPGRLMNNSSFEKSSEILTHESRKENVRNNIALYSKQSLESPTKKQREILASNNINSNTMSGLPGDSGITELAPGIRIQGQVAEL